MKTVVFQPCPGKSCKVKGKHIFNQLTWLFRPSEYATAPVKTLKFYLKMSAVSSLWHSFSHVFASARMSTLREGIVMRIWQLSTHSSNPITCFMRWHKRLHWCVSWKLKWGKIDTHLSLYRPLGSLFKVIKLAIVMKSF